MKRLPVAAFVCAATALVLLMPVSASAQELEPGAYWPLPEGLNIITVVNNFNWGDVAFDPSAPIDQASASINTTALAFTRAFSLGGRSANAGVVVPVSATFARLTCERGTVGKPASELPTREGWLADTMRSP